MKLLAIITTEDYADEFDYPIISFFTEELQRFILLHGLGMISEDEFQEMYFGSNEALSFTKEDVIRMIRNAREIPQDEIVLARKYLEQVSGASLDLVNNIVDILHGILHRAGDKEILETYDDILTRYVPI